MWQMQGDIAQLSLASLELQIPWQTPWLGISSRRIFNSQNAMNLKLLQPHLQAQIQTDNSVQEAYIRGADLVVTFAPLQTAREPIYWQIYYRAWNNDLLHVSGLEIILSAHTAALHSQPAMQLVSEFGNYSTSEEVLTRNIEGSSLHTTKKAQVTLYRPKQEAFSYLEMVHPSDFSGVDHQKGRLSWSLFPESLEKGVIRRVRACGLFLPRQNDEWNTVNSLVQQFMDSPPILTT
jgi:hypothetical protein